jgi:hypothetical protein
LEDVLTRFTFIFGIIAVLFASPLRADTGSDENESGTPPKPEKRIFGVVPNYRTVDSSLPFSPLSNRQKLSIAAHDSFDWPTYVLAGGFAFLRPGAKEATAYGGGVEGYVNRYVRSGADQIMGNMLSEGLLPIVLHEDPRYFRLGTGRFGTRLASALSQIVVARNDKDRPTFNISEFLGNAIAVGVSTAYSPTLDSWSRRTDKLFLMISTDALSNVIKEFGPDIRQRFLPHKHKSS